MLELQTITKAFPGVRALENVSLKFEKGKIHGIIGENGAGKSTLIKIISGIYSDYSGKIILRGEEVRFKSYKEAEEAGVAVVNQEIEVFQAFSIAENVYIDKLDHFKNKITRKIDWKTIYANTSKYLSSLGLALDPRMNISSLSTAQKQMVQIAKAISCEMSILILDEPTSALTPHEVKQLFTILKSLKNKGITILFISHKLEEIKEICDDIFIIRDGKNVGCMSIENFDHKNVIEMMIGREYNVMKPDKLFKTNEKPLLSVRNLSCMNLVRDVNLEVYPGEIVGIYGLVGAGRTELAKTIMGQYKKDSGDIIKNGREVRINSVEDALYRYKIGYMSENRKEDGLFLDLSVRENIIMAAMPYIKKNIISPISRKKEISICRETGDSINIKYNKLEDVVELLSGGNQQKVCLARLLVSECDVLIIDEPTIGVDVGAKESIYNIFYNIAENEKKAVIIISSDLPEILRLSNRLYLMKEGSIVHEFSSDELYNKDKDQITKKIGKLLT